jgi:hypothetical protein
MDQADLELLGYSPKWIECGFLTPENLLAQVAWFHSSDDQCTEHYRYATFRIVLRRASFSEREFCDYIELATLDPDSLMGRAALIDLLHHPGLTEDQWETLLAYPRIQELPRLAKKERLLKELRNPQATEQTFWRCIEEGDGDIHRRLLDMRNLPRPMIEALHQNGANQAVRNIAGGRLKRSSGSRKRRTVPEEKAQVANKQDL